MNRRIPQKGHAAVLTTAILAGCFAWTCETSNPQAIFIMDAAAVTFATQCTIRPGQAAQAIWPYGRLDLALSNQYWLFPRFRNMLNPIRTVTGETLETPQAEAHYLSVQVARVFLDMGEFSPKNSDTTATKQLGYKYMFEGVESQVAAGVGPLTEGIVAVQAIPPELGNVLDKKMQEAIRTVSSPAVWVTAYVTLIAQMQDGTVVQSNEFAFPIQLCWGCLVVPSCPDQIQQLPCNVGQDESIPGTVCQCLANHPEGCPVDCGVACWPSPT